MTTKTCQNCQVSHGPDDMFCENCGYDFITGSLPAEAGLPAAGSASESASASGGKPAAAAPVAAAPSVLNDDERAATAGPPSDASGDVPRLRIVVSVDRSYFDAVVNDGEIDFPDPIPADQDLDLAGSELHIGRTSDSRAIHPDIDVADLTGDQAVSSRHAVLRVANDGTYTIVDVGSTNGTFLEDVNSDAITHGVPMEVKVGVPMFVGAWTRLTIAE